MATAIRIIGHGDRLSLIDHLDELRSRLIISLIAFAVAFGVCYWQNAALLKFVNAPLVQQTRPQVEAGTGPMGRVWATEKAIRAVSGQMGALAKTLSAPSSSLPAATRSALSREAAKLQAATAKLPSGVEGYNPTTIGFGEPFTQTLTVTLYFALLFSLPILLFELYGFIVPAFSPSERKIALPLMLAVPFLFAAGVAFGYYVVVPAAVSFFQNFNANQFNVLVQASSYYKFEFIILIAMGILFQVPVGILGVTHTGVVTPKQLRKGRRYAILICAAIAALLPGGPATLVLETIPLYILYEASVLIASIVYRNQERKERREAAASAAGGAAHPAGGTALAGVSGSSERSAGGAAEPIDPAVREMIDHIDPDLHG